MNANPYVFAIVGVIVWKVVSDIRQAARDFQAADRYDVFAGDEDE